ncbi:MAG: CocE/NonD family hydrolase [Actinomycetota bacterium]|nr:CocE/NonD family hydrolase [Actinomycetota bacterium]
MAVEAPNGMIVSKDVMVPMRDGVRLATDIYRPALDGELIQGRFPTLLGRTSYDKNYPWMWVEAVAEYFAPRGYAVVVQDLRGRRNSEGVGQYAHVNNKLEGPDGYDTVEWIASQPWSNGQIGTVGSSHGAIVQHVLALHSPPHLGAMWIDVGPTNGYKDHIREGGALQIHQFVSHFAHAHDAPEIRNDRAARKRILDAMMNMRQWVSAAPWKPGQTPLVVVPALEKNFFEYYYRGAYDDFWAQEAQDQERHFGRHADVPITFSGGWYDSFSTSTTNYYAKMAKKNRSLSRLVMGPWMHSGMRNGHSHTGDVEFGPSAAWGKRYNEERLRWFDRWLRGIENGVEKDPVVRIFVMGGGDGKRTKEGRLYHGGQWRDEKEWPLARTEYTEFYLHPGGLLTTKQPPADAAPARFTFDPEHPVPTVGGAGTVLLELMPTGHVDPLDIDHLSIRYWWRMMTVLGPTHQKEEPGMVAARPPYFALATRPDVLVFQTELLKDEKEVTGPIVVKLWISSSAVDTDFTAKLIDVYPATEDYPEGYHMNLVDSIIRTRFRNSFETEELMKPGEVYKVQVNLPPTSNLFKAGHRIRVDISSSNFPRLDVNPNTGEPSGRYTHMVRADNAVYIDRSRPSHVVLPVIPT